MVVTGSTAPLLKLPELNAPVLDATVLNRPVLVRPVLNQLVLTVPADAAGVEAPTLRLPVL